MTMNNEFYTVVDDTIERAIEAQGDKMITLDPALDQKKQNEQIQYLLDHGVEAIFLNPIDWKGIRPGLEAAKKAGVPIIVIDAPVYDTDLVETTIVSDNYQAGVLCAQNLMQQVTSANILLLTHENAKSAVDRIKGFTDTIEKNPGNYKIVKSIDTEGQTERTLPKVEQYLNENSDIQAIMCLNDPTALGALAALDSLNYGKDVLVYGVDGSPDGKVLIQEGMLYGTAMQSPKEMGEKAASVAYRLIKGEKVEKSIVLPVRMIDQSNIGLYEIDSWQ